MKAPILIANFSFLSDCDISIFVLTQKFWVAGGSGEYADTKA
jgi:hypothetical protein